MTIPVYESHDGQGYNSFTRTVTTAISFDNNGINTTVTGVTLKKSRPTHAEYIRPLPVNYKRITLAQAIKALVAVQYGYMLVSTAGTNILEYHNLPADTRYQWGV